MVTYGATAMTKWIVANCPVPIRSAMNEAGLSSDKKASAMSFQNVRGRRVTAEVIVPKDVCQKVLHASPESMVKHKTNGAYSHLAIQAIGSTFHAANILAAVYIACGQDPASVAESHVGISRFSVRSP
jgi:hydroxymethylglutaryl-CoA reductase (NADPH)